MPASSQPGQPVEFRVESFGDAVFTGQSRLRQPVARRDDAHVHGRSARRQQRPAAEAGLLREGRDPDASRRRGAWRCRTAAVSTLAGVSSVYVVRDGKITQQSVTLGVRQGDLWEVVDGSERRRDARGQPSQRAGHRRQRGRPAPDRRGRRRPRRRRPRAGRRKARRRRGRAASGEAENEACRCQRPPSRLRRHDERRAHRARLGLVPAISGST